MSIEPTANPMRAWLSVVRCYQLCNDAIAARLKPLGLKVQHYEVLARLAAHPQQTQQQLAENGYVVKSHMSLLIAEMEALGWVQRSSNTHDKRSKTVSLTAHGQELAAQAADVQQAVMQAMFAPLTPRQIAGVQASTEQVVQALLDLQSSS